MYATANDAQGPYFLFVPPSLFLRNISGGNGVVSFLNPYLRVPIVSSRNEFVKDAFANNRDPFLIAFLVLLILLLSETLTFSLLLSAPHGTVSPLSVSLYSVIQNLRYFRFNLISRKSKCDTIHRALQKSRSKVWILGAVVVTTLLLFQFTVIVLTHRNFRPVRNSRISLQIIQPISPDWNFIWNASSRMVNQPCVAVTIVNAGRELTRLNNCVTSNLSANRFEPYELVQPDVQVNATIITDLHKYGADHILTIGGESVEFVARSYFSFDDMQERIMKQRSQFNRIDRQMAVIHQQFFAYLFSSYARTSGDPSLTLERLRALRVNIIPSTNGPMKMISQTDGGARLFSTSSFRFESRFSGVMPRGVAALRFGQAFFKGIIAVEIGPNDARDLIPGLGITEADAVMWRERYRKLNWVGLLVMTGGLGAAVLVVRIWLKPTNELEATGEGLKGGKESALLMEAREDDGEREFLEKCMRMRSLGTGIGGEEYSAKAEEYSATGYDE